MITVITAVFGGYDDIRLPTEQTIDYEWLAISGKTDLPPRLAAKQPKMMPWQYARSDIVIWIDAAAEITSPTFVADVVAELGDAAIAQYPHRRNDIYLEAEVSLGMDKYADQHEAIKRQVDYYRHQGHPANWGLWQAGVIVYNSHKTNWAFGREWFNECRRFSHQDQISQPYLLRKYGITPVELHSGGLTWHPHNDAKTKTAP